MSAPETEDLEETAGSHLSGYLIICTLLGAALGKHAAQVQPINPLKRTAQRIAEAQMLDQLIPYVIAGAALGLVLGIISERFLPKWKPTYWIYGIIAVIILWFSSSNGLLV